MEREAELERIRFYTVAARQRIRRLDVLLKEQARILNLDPALSRNPRTGHTITRIEIKVFAAGFGLAALSAFLAGFWIAHLH